MAMTNMIRFTRDIAEFRKATRTVMSYFEEKEQMCLISLVDSGSPLVFKQDSNLVYGYCVFNARAPFFNGVMVPALAHIFYAEQLLPEVCGLRQGETWRGRETRCLYTLRMYPGKRYYPAGSEIKREDLPGLIEFMRMVREKRWGG